MAKRSENNGFDRVFVAVFFVMEFIQTLLMIMLAYRTGILEQIVSLLKMLLR